MILIDRIPWNHFPGRLQELSSCCWWMHGSLKLFKSQMFITIYSIIKCFKIQCLYHWLSFKTFNTDVSRRNCLMPLVWKCNKMNFPPPGTKGVNDCTKLWRADPMILLTVSASQVPHRCSYILPGNLEKSHKPLQNRKRKVMFGLGGHDLALEIVEMWHRTPRKYDLVLLLNHYMHFSFIVCPKEGIIAIYRSTYKCAVPNYFDRIYKLLVMKYHSMQTSGVRMNNLTVPFYFLFLL